MSGAFIAITVTALLVLSVPFIKGYISGRRIMQIPIRELQVGVDYLMAALCAHVTTLIIDKEARAPLGIVLLVALVVTSALLIAYLRVSGFGGRGRIRLTLVGNTFGFLALELVILYAAKPDRSLQLHGAFLVTSTVHAWSAATWAAVIAAIATTLTAVVYIAIAIYARSQVNEVRRSRQEQTRPFVVVDFEPGWIIYLTIENIGKTMARQVVVAFDKPLETTLSKPNKIEESPLFREPIPSLAPGRKISLVFDSFNDRFAKALPRVYRVTIRYEGIDGTEYEENYPLDLGIHEGTSPPDKGLPDLVQQVEEIKGQLKSWTESLNGVHVYATDYKRHSRIKQRPFRVQQAKTLLKDKGIIAVMQWWFDLTLRRRGWRR